jgi:hypothetical protein
MYYADWVEEYFWYKHIDKYFNTKTDKCVRIQKMLMEGTRV